MDFMQLAKSRYSVREFSDKQIERDKLNLILQAGIIAPTAANKQPQRIYVLESEQALKKFQSVCRRTFNAPTVLMITADEAEAWKSSFSDDYHTGDIDCSIVCTHMMLQAFELGIGSCWVGSFDLEKAKELFNLPQSEKVIVFLPLGYPAENVTPSPMHDNKKPLDETVKFL